MFSWLTWSDPRSYTWYFLLCKLTFYFPTVMSVIGCGGLFRLVMV